MILDEQERALIEDVLSHAVVAQNDKKVRDRLLERLADPRQEERTHDQLERRCAELNGALLGAITWIDALRVKPTMGDDEEQRLRDALLKWRLLLGEPMPLMTDLEGREARNLLAPELDRIDGGHSTSLIECARRAAELLKLARELVGRSPLGYHNGRLMTCRGTTDADIVEWLQKLDQNLGAHQ